MFDHAARDAATRRQPDDRNVRGRRARREQTVRLFHLFRTERRIEQDQAGQVVRGLDDGFEARARKPHAEAGRRQLSLSGFAHARVTRGNKYMRIVRQGRNDQRRSWARW